MAGTYFILYDFNDYFEKDAPSFLQREKFLEIINSIFKNLTPLQRQAIIIQYTDWDNLKDGYAHQKQIADVVGDYYFICPTNHFAQVFADTNVNVYYYYFTQRTSTNLWGEWMGVMHGDEVEYVFGHPLNMSIQFRDKERDLSLRMMQAFARFALTGKPAADEASWPPYSRDDPIYYVFNAEHAGTGRGPRSQECAFWNELLPALADGAEGGRACGGDGAAGGEGSAWSSAPATRAPPALALTLALALAAAATATQQLSGGRPAV